MKRFSLLLLSLLCTAATTFAYDFQSGDLYYNITGENTVEVTYQEYWSSTNYQSLTTATIPETVTNDGTTYSVTSIGDNAFLYCESLISITIPNSVTSIGSSAFYGCSSLTSTITIPNSVTSIGSDAFSYCSSLTSITIPNSVTSIGYNAFLYCESLTSITIPNSVTSIGAGAFSGCSSLPVVDNLRYADTYLVKAVDKSLSTYTIKAGTKWIGDDAFGYCSSLTSITIPNSVTSIGDHAFDECSSLTSITIPNSVTSIGQSAFGGCSSLPVVDNVRYADTYLVGAVDESLSTYTIKAGTKWIGDYAFNGCSSLTSITIPNSVTSIGYEAFAYCSSLTSIAIPNSVTSIGYEAFSGCSALTSIVVESGNAVYDSRENCNAIIETATNTLIAGCQSTTIPNSVTSIGGHAFNGCSSLTSITIPNSVTSIGDYAFYNVPNIVYSGEATGSPWGAKSINGYVDSYLVYADETKATLLACSSAASGEITIPNSVTSIGEEAFYGCSALTSITIPESVTSIGVGAFGDCSSLTSITIPESITSIGYGAFSGCSSLTSITIPNSVTSIGNYAFRGCSSLTTITIPESITSIGVGAFGDCSSLTSITIPESITSIEGGTFDGCSALTSITIPNSVTSIGRSAFAYCSALTSITIPNSVTSIGDYAFWNVPNIVYYGPATGSPWGAKSINGYVDGYLVYADETKATLLACSGAATGEITIPNSVTSIGEYAFRSCSALTTITIPNSVTSIGEAAFYDCSGLTEFTIPENITYLGDQVFKGCSGITSITWNAKRCQDRWKDLNYYSQLPFYDIYSQISSFTFGETVDSIPSYLCYGMSNLANITIPENIKYIGGGVFNDCSGLTSVTWNAINCSNDVGDGSGNIYIIFKNANAHITSFTIGEKVEVIPGTLCYGLSELTSITIPNSVKTIGNHAFRDCSGLTAIGIPENVTSIGSSAFSGCSALTSITCLATTPPTCENTCFDEVPRTIPLYVPAESVKDYKTAAVWQEFYNVGESDAPTAIKNALNTDTKGGQKIIRDGQVLIIRNGETYDMMGQRL